MFPLPSIKYVEWEKAAMWEIKRQVAHNPGVKYPLQHVQKIVVYLYYGTHRIKDNTNTVESVHDMLVKIGILEDDSWQVLPDTRQIGAYRQRDPGCKIVLTVKD